MTISILNMIGKYDESCYFGGGLGTRLSEYTNVIPKPMVKIGPLPNNVLHIS